jgi:hypothetical protein
MCFLAKSSILPSKYPRFLNFPIPKYPISNNLVQSCGFRSLGHRLAHFPRQIPRLDEKISRDKATKNRSDSYTMQPIIFTPRLKLTLIIAAERDSPEFRWIHKLRSDEKAMFWTLVFAYPLWTP